MFANFSPVPKYYIKTTFLPDKQSVYNKRVVQYYELEYIHEGSGKIFVNGEFFPAKQGFLHFRCPGMVVQGFGQYKSSYFVFYYNEDHSVNKDLEKLDKLYFFKEEGEILPIISSLFQNYYNNLIFNDLHYKINILKLFELMVLKSQAIKYSESVNSQIFANINLTIDYIKTNYKNNITLEILANISGYSTYHFIRLFKKVTGYTPIYYLNIQKIVKAQQLLIETDLNVENIMSECGFKSYNYFYTVFKRICLTSPTEFREKHKLY